MSCGTVVDCLASQCGGSAEFELRKSFVVKQINLLEGETGVRLFVRTRRGIALTDAGRAFQSESKKIIALSEESIRRVQRIGASSIQRIRLGTSLLRPARYFLHLWSEIYKKPLAHRVQIVPFLDNSYADYLNIVQSLGRNMDVIATSE